MGLPHLLVDDAAQLPGPGLRLGAGLRMPPFSPQLSGVVAVRYRNAATWALVAFSPGQNRSRPSSSAAHPVVRPWARIHATGAEK